MTLALMEAVVDEARPGVLVRAIGCEGHSVTIERAVAGGEWLPVRSGFPARVIGGEAAAYDWEAEPGTRVSYRAVGEQTTASMVATVDVPPLQECTGAACSTWLKHIERPGLSVRARILHPDSPSRAGRGSFVEPDGAGVLPHYRSQGLSGRQGSYTVRVSGWDALDALDRLLAEPGTVLLHANPAHGLRAMYLAVTGAAESRPGSTPGWEWRDVEFSWRQVGRPWPSEAPLLVPSWTWRDAIRDAATLRQVAGRYPTRWDLLLAGTRAARSA